MIIERLGSPYYDCVNYTIAIADAVTCFLNESLKFALNVCGCRCSWEAVFGDNLGDPPFCSQWQLNCTALRLAVLCELKALEERSHALKSKCKLSCSETIYDTKHSENSWPLISQVESFIDSFIKNGSQQFASMVKYLQENGHKEIDFRDYCDSQFFKKNNISLFQLQKWIQKHVAHVSVFMESIFVKEMVTIARLI